MYSHPESIIFEAIVAKAIYPLVFEGLNLARHNLTTCAGSNLGDFISEFGHRVEFVRNIPATGRFTKGGPISNAYAVEDWERMRRTINFLVTFVGDFPEAWREETKTAYAEFAKECQEAYVYFDQHSFSLRGWNKE